MQYRVIIDGNNLLHAMYEGARLQSMTRAALVRVLEQWARETKDQVTLVFDGAPPREGFRKTVSSNHLTVTFSAPETADDVIVRMVHQARHPETLRVVSSDRAIAYEARRRRSLDVCCADFMEEITSDTNLDDEAPPAESEKPGDAMARGETDQWLETFGVDEEQDPFDGFGDMQGL